MLTNYVLKLDDINSSTKIINNLNSNYGNTLKQYKKGIDYVVLLKGCIRWLYRNSLFP